MKVAKLLAILAGAAILLAGVWTYWPLGGEPAPLLSDAAAYAAPGAAGEVIVGLTIENRGGPDRLTAVRSDEATSAEIVGGTAPEGLPIPAGSRPALAVDGAHIRLAGITGDLAEGRLLPLTLIFERAGAVATRARITAPELDAHAAHGADTTLDLGPVEVAPKVVMDLRPVGEGWDVTLDTGAFTLTADGLDGPNVPGKGHAHLYLGGLKLQRLYGPTAHIGALPKGQHILQVILNTHDHRAIHAGGNPVGAIALIDVR